MTLPAGAVELADLSYVPPSAAGHAWVIVLCVGVLGLGAGAAIVAMFLRAQRLARAQRSEDAEMHAKAASPLSAGPARVVRGRVETVGNEDVAAEIDVVQTVKNHRSKSSRWHTWNEASRSVRAAPFYLVRDDGEAVYVEPDSNLLVVDALETRYPDDCPGQRVRAAVVRRGEELFAYGDLVEAPHPRAQGGYRGGTGFVLRPRRRGGMRLATEALRERYAARIAHLRLASALLGATFVAWHVLVTVPFLVASFAGTGEWASVTEASTYVTHSKHGSTTHYRLAVRDSEGLTLTQDVPYETFSRVREVRGRAGSAVVPVVRTGSARASYVGSEPFVQVAWIVMGFVAALVGAGVVAGKHGAKVAWYDRKRLVEHGGTGYWQETRPRMPVDPSAS